MQLAKALVCQMCAALIALAMVYWSPDLGGKGFLVVQSVMAALLSRLVHQPIWWLPIQLIFLPAAVGASMLALPGEIYLLVLLLLILLFWGTIKGDVPLFLSSTAVSEALAEMVEHGNLKHFIDLGAGIGSVVVPLAKRCPHLQITAIERAPLPWLIAWLRCLSLSNVTVRIGDLWAQNLQDYDLVFAFLSPVPMPKLGEKSQAEMNPGSLLVSSSFPLPNRQPETIIELDDLRKTRLYCYR